MGNQLSCCFPGQKHKDRGYCRSLDDGIQPSTEPMYHAASPDTPGCSFDGRLGMEVAKSGTSSLNKPDESTLATDSSRDRDYRIQPHDSTASSAKPAPSDHEKELVPCSRTNHPRSDEVRGGKFSENGQTPATRTGTSKKASGTVLIGGLARAPPPFAGGRTQRSAGLRPTLGPRHAHPHDRQFTHQAAAAVGVVRLNGRVGAKSGATCVRRGFSSKYDLEGVLGTGSSATCYRCTDKRTRKHFACKVINKRMMDSKMKPLLAHFRMEIQVLRRLQHPNIIHMEDAFESDSKIEMVLEIMQGGELFDYIVEKGTLSESDASIMVRKVTSGLAYMHSMRVMHRDLKPENLMLATKGVEPEIKIIDFGLSKIMRSSDEEDQQFVGTRGYISPEMLQRRPYTKAIDVWGLGVIVYVVLCGCLPFGDDITMLDRAGVKKKFDLRFPKWAEDISSGAKGLLSELLVVTPQARMTAEEALEHPWVTGLTAGADKFLESPRTLRQLRSKSGKMATVGRRGVHGCEANEVADLSSAGAAAAQEAFRQAEFREQSDEYVKGSNRLRLGGEDPTKYCDRLRKHSI